MKATAWLKIAAACGLAMTFVLPWEVLALAKKPHEKSGNGEYVFLLHGLARTPRSMSKMKKYFEGHGYQVVNVGYDSRQYPIEWISNEILNNEIEKKYIDRSKKIHFVTHSLGGIIVRAYFQDHHLPNAGRIVMLSPPNQGSALAEKLKENFVYKTTMGPAGQQLGTGPNSVPLKLKPINHEIGIITGNQSANWVFSSMIPGADDGKVSVEEAKLDEARDFLVLPMNHSFIMYNDMVCEQALTFIQAGKFSIGGAED